MPKLVNIIHELDDGSGNSFQNLNVDEIPNSCPICKTGIRPINHQGFKTDTKLQYVFRCPNCQSLFIGIYDYDIVYMEERYYLKNIIPKSITTQEFSKIINDVSKSFCKIYNQSTIAESFGLNLIAGPGYRKSLEYLIKDYLIDKNPKIKDEIQKKFLGNCIQDHIENEKIKEVSQRVVWLGNDETHYYKLWEDKDIYDLKDTINLTISWIEMEIQTTDLLSSMPKKEK